MTKNFKDNIMSGTGFFVAVEDILTNKKAVAGKINAERKRRFMIKLESKYHNICAICGKKIEKDNKINGFHASADHIIPKSFGGSNKFENLQLTHIMCNVKRGNRIIEKFPEWFGVDNHEII